MLQQQQKTWAFDMFISLKVNDFAQYCVYVGGWVGGWVCLRASLGRWRLFRDIRSCWLHAWICLVSLSHESQVSGEKGGDIYLNRVGTSIVSSLNSARVRTLGWALLGLFSRIFRGSLLVSVLPWHNPLWLTGLRTPTKYWYLWAILYVLWLCCFGN